MKNTKFNAKNQDSNLTDKQQKVKVDFKGRYVYASFQGNWKPELFTSVREEKAFYRTKDSGADSNESLVSKP